MAGSPQQLFGASRPLKEYLRGNIPKKLMKAELTPEKPPWAKTPTSSLSASQKRGLAFEKQMVKMLRKKTKHPVLSETWVRYWDQSGEHYCSPDIIIPDLRIVVECKLTRTKEAEAQLQLLYGPVLSWLWPGSWSLVVAAKYWAGDERRVLACPLDAEIGLNFYVHGG